MRPAPEPKSTPAPTGIAAALRRIRAAADKGDGFAAFDLALRAALRHPNSLALAHQAVLQAARIGALSEAARLFAQFGLSARSEEADPLVPAEDVLALAARLHKEQALETFGPERSARLAAAAAEYLAVFARTGGTYSLVNAADLLALAGDEAAAARHARRTLRLLAKQPAATSAAEARWRALTAVEARLVLGQVDEARTAAAAARAGARGSYGDLGTAIRQLTRLAEAKRLDFVPGRELGMPGVLAYSGHMTAPPGQDGPFPAAREPEVAAAIASFLDTTPVGWGFGSLAAGADILVAEALLARGIEAHVVLPFAQAEFVAVSVRPSGEHWVRRFERCLARAASCRTVVEGGYYGDDALFGGCTAYALGLAKLQATHLGAGLTQLLVWDGQARPGAMAGTASDHAMGRALGLPVQIISPRPGAAAGPHPARPGKPQRQRRSRAMVFADVVGFSRISDDALPAFHVEVMAPMAAAIRRLPTQPSVVETWGDAVFLVYEDVAAAAEAAMTLVAVLGPAARPPQSALPAYLNLRVSAHFGAVFDITNPFTGKPGCLGLHVSRAARIEPVTPPGAVYVSEAFAAQIALLPHPRYRADFVGTTKLAKKFGNLPVFRLITLR